MAEVVTNINIKNINKEKFSKWFNEKLNNIYASYENASDGYDFCVSVFDYGNFQFWEAFAFMMVQEFEEIIFQGCYDIYFDDHCAYTTISCDGKEIIIKRGVSLPDYFEEFDEDDEDYEYYKEEAESLRAEFELDYDIPYLVKFSVDEAIICSKICETINNKLEDTAFVKSICAEYKMSFEKFMQFATILKDEFSK